MTSLLLWLFACNGGGLTETGNPNLTASLTVTARTSEPTEVALDADDAPVVIAVAEVAIERARLVTGEVCDAAGETEYDVPVPPVIDLIAGEQAISFPAESGDYCRVRVRLDDSGEHSALVTGVRADGAPFEIRSTQDPEIDVRSRGEPFTLDEATKALVLAFDAAAWIDPATLDAAAPDGDGVVRIDEDANEAALAAFDARFAASLALFEDVDADAVLSADEEDDPLATSE